jgi:hypothetical protein
LTQNIVPTRQELSESVLYNMKTAVWPKFGFANLTIGVCGE